VAKGTLSKKGPDTRNCVLRWAPRILSIVFVLFLSLFSLDVFEPGRSIPWIVAAFLIHNIPSFSLAAIVFVAWKRPVAGGIFFLLAGLSFTLFFGTYSSLPEFLLVSFPVFLVGALYLLDGYFGGKARV
jgi:hypothetical protein